jgi:DNA polymerase-3 subunit chi
VTTVAFHFNVADRLTYTCRLIRKAVAGGAKLVVTGSSDTLSQLDGDLWTFSRTDFVTHCQPEASKDIAARSSVLLFESTQLVPRVDVLVNLGDPVPDRFQRFDRVIEVVGKEADDKRFARLRWKHYLQTGVPLSQHNMDQKTVA